LAKLIAWEELKVLGSATAAPQLSGPPTVLNNGKVRLLVGRNATEVALDKLSQADQDFVKQIAAAAKKAATPGAK
jgi:hypothetical protein